MDNKFSVEEQYQEYLKMVKMPEGAMHPIQRVETKRAFFGAWGQFILLLNETVTEMPEEEFVEKLASMTDEVLHFWKTTNNDY